MDKTTKRNLKTNIHTIYKLNNVDILLKFEYFLYFVFCNAH